MATHEKIINLDFNDTNSVRSLLLELFQTINEQKQEITLLRDDYEQLQKAKDEMAKRMTKLERYSSYMCLTFHGVRDGGEYPVHKIVEIIRSVQIPIEPYDIAACHYLPGNGRTKPIIVKFIYNHQRDKVWHQRNSFFDPPTGGKIHINERLSETDRDLYNYCRKEKNLVTATHKNQVRVKVSENDKKWLPVDTRKQADSITNNSVLTRDINEWDMECPNSISNKDEKKTPYKRNRQEAFNSPIDETQMEVSNQNYKLDKLCSLTEKLFTLLVEKQSPPSKKCANEERNNDSCNPGSEGT